MLLDRLDRAARYAAMHPGFAAGFEFLRTADWATLGSGRHVLDGDRLAVIIDRATGRGRAQSPLESHRRYIDIQYVFEGTEWIGWLPTERCQQTTVPFDPAKDIAFYGDRPATWLEIPRGYFAIFYPEDAHAPQAGDAPMQKAIVKVAVDW
jgi:biofilm protein TabA